MVEQIIDAINEIDIIACESSLDTLISIGNSYDKMSVILENCKDNNVDDFKIFMESDMLYQEGKIGDEIKHQNQGHGTINKILMFPIRLIVAIYRVITKTTQAKAEKGRSVNKKIKNNKETKSKLSAIWDFACEHPVAASLAALGTAGAVAGVAYGGYKGIQALVNKFKNRKSKDDDAVLKKIFEEAGLIDHYNRLDSEDNKLGALLIHCKKRDSINGLPEKYKKEDPVIVHAYEFFILLKKSKQLAQDEINLLKQALVKVSDKSLKKKGEGLLKKLEKNFADYDFDGNLKEISDTLNKAGKPIPSDDEIKSINLTIVESSGSDDGSGDGSGPADPTISKAVKDLEAVSSRVLQSNDTARFPNSKIRSYVDSLRKDEHANNKLASGYIVITDEICLRINICDAHGALIGYLDELKKKPFWSKKDDSLNEKQTNIKHCMEELLNKTVDEFLKALSIEGNKSFKWETQVQNSIGFMDNKNINNTLNVLGSYQNGYLDADINDPEIKKIIDEYNKTIQSMMNLLKDFYEIINCNIDAIYAAGKYLEENKLKYRNVSGETKTITTTTANENTDKYFKPKTDSGSGS